MKLFTMAADKLQQVAVLAQTTEARAESICLDYDWNSNADHQQWLDTASSEEISSWLAECIKGEDEADADIAAGLCDAG